MIVVDANILVYLALPSQLTPLAESLLVNHPVWFAPSLWRSEFRNVLARYLQKSVLTLSQAFALQDMIEEILA
ncbi:MAG: type II toxin-antitoxin system VapC family toxin, partial [Alphaproteobacteria bacterium]